MQYGVILPNVGPLATIDNLARIAQSAESMGYDGVFLSDHVAIPTQLRSAYPYRSDGRFPLTADDLILEPITALSYLAAVTSSIKLGFSVLVLPYRHPVLNAKMLATLDVISNGRLIIGAGVGWMEEEFNALDSDFHDRGPVTDEHIIALRKLWSSSNVEIAGQYYNVSGVAISPKPVQQPNPPIWTGGISPPALRRAAALGDGWHGVRQSPGDVAKVVESISSLRADAGLSMTDYAISLRAGLDVANTPFTGRDRTPLRGAPAQLADDLVAYAYAGLTYLIVEPRAQTPEEFLTQLERFSRVAKP